MLRRFVVATALAIGVAALPTLSMAQYGGSGLGSALSSNALSHQGQVRAGVDDITRHVDQETPFKIIKDVKVGMKDADPNARVQELKKLRDLQDPEANKILLEALADPDLRVRVKAVDLLGVRQANDGVEPISRMLFLRSTEPLARLHATAALGRIGDARGALAVMQYLDEERASNDDERARGTAVYALGEIGDEKSTEMLTKVATGDGSEMVRRLAQEALQKVDGELPTTHSKMLAQQKEKLAEPTDIKNAKLREIDAKIQESER